MGSAQSARCLQTSEVAPRYTRVVKIPIWRVNNVELTGSLLVAGRAGNVVA
jgi:hypothetical protein